MSSSDVGLERQDASEMPLREESSAALPQPETGATPVIQTRMIRPLGEQIIIRTIPQSEVRSIIIPDSAKGITMIGDKGESDAVHFVEAEVIAVGPGKRTKGDPDLLLEMAEVLKGRWDFVATKFNPVEIAAKIRENEDRVLGLIDRAENPQLRIPPLVKPGDRILYHPAVQRFDRKVEGLGEGEYFIIREESVLAVIER
jgi:co-chaperonin GroES (HSP10)